MHWQLLATILDDPSKGFSQPVHHLLFSDLKVRLDDAGEQLLANRHRGSPAAVVNPSYSDGEKVDRQLLDASWAARWLHGPVRGLEAVPFWRVQIRGGCVSELVDGVTLALMVHCMWHPHYTAGALAFGTPLRWVVSAPIGTVGAACWRA